MLMHLLLLQFPLKKLILFDYFHLFIINFLLKKLNLFLVIHDL